MTILARQESRLRESLECASSSSEFDGVVTARTVGMERLSDEPGDMASLSDVVCQCTPAEIKMPEASPKLVIDLLGEADEHGVAWVQRHEQGSDRRRGKRAIRGRRD